jgi:hypothetical protein
MGRPNGFALKEFRGIAERSADVLYRDAIFLRHFFGGIACGDGADYDAYRYTRSFNHRLTRMHLGINGKSWRNHDHGSTSDGL